MSLDPYRVNSLILTDDVDPLTGTVHWDPARSFWNGGMLAAALLLGPPTFTWSAFATFTWSAFATFIVLLAITMCVGHSVGFHRLIHRTFVVVLANIIYIN